MRKFTDRDGARWDVVLGRESWGALLALFVPVSGGGAVRQAMLQASAQEVAMQELDTMDDTALQDLLERSVVRDEA